MIWFISFVLFITLILAGIPALAEEGDVDLRDFAQISGEPGDARQLRVEILNWKVRYYQCLLSNIELAKCCHDKRRMEIEKELDEVNKEIRALLIGAPIIKQPKEERQK